MRTRWFMLTIGLLAAAPLAAQQQPPANVAGRRVQVRLTPGGTSAAGELLAIGRDSLWLLAAGPSRVIAVPTAAVQEAVIRRHNFTATRGFLWGLGVGFLSGLGLTAACNSIQGECGGILAGSMIGGALFGGLAALSFEVSGRQVFAPPAPGALSGYARFPQGPPPGVTLTDLAEPPPKP